MSYWKFTPRKVDRLFSEYIRKRAGYRCEFCGKVCKVGDEWIAKLEASHYIGRGHETVRFDPENVISLCFSDHKRLGGYKKDEDGEYDLWMKQRLGEKAYRNLVVRGHIPGKKDDLLTEIYVKELLKELED